MEKKHRPDELAHGPASREAATNRRARASHESQSSHEVTANFDADGAARPARPASRDTGPAPTIPSSLDMDRRASAARTGQAEMAQRRREHTETSPEVSGGDVDADWVAGHTVGDETPAGDNPTPGMSVVEDIGKALGVQYEDAEELKPVEKIAARDRHRWELDPASSEDYQERNREK